MENNMKKILERRRRILILESKIVSAMIKRDYEAIIDMVEKWDLTNEELIEVANIPYYYVSALGIVKGNKYAESKIQEYKEKMTEEEHELFKEKITEKINEE